MDGPWDGNAALLETVQREILNLTSGEFQVRFPEQYSLVGDWEAETISAHLERLLRSPEVDVVVALGLVASELSGKMPALPKPTIAPFIVDPEIQAFPQKSGVSGVKNFSYIAFPSTIERDLQTFREITPFDSLLFFFSKPFIEVSPQKKENLLTILKKMGITATLVGVDKLADAMAALENHPPKAVYLAPLLHLPGEDWQTLIREINACKLASFSMFGLREVELGVLASIRPDFIPKLSRRIALNVQRILLGEDAGKIPYAFSMGKELSINMKTARQIGVYPPWDVLTEATLIEEERTQISRQLSLVSAVQEGLSANQSLLARQAEVRAGRGNIGAARANLLPQIAVSATGVQIDQDRAGPFQAEKTLTGAATFTQLLFNDDAWTNYTVQKKLQQSLEAAGELTRQDIARVIATAYLNLLNAKTLERIQKENLKISGNNLELARIRESVGFSGPADLYRWQSEIASNRREVIAANARRNLAEIQLNRLLNRPLEEKFQTSEALLSDEALLLSERRISPYIQNPWSFKIFRSFLVEEGLGNSQELKQLDAQIAVQDRLLSNANRRFFLPSLAFQGEFSRYLKRDGEGSEPLTLDPSSPLTPLLSALDTGDDNNWSLALRASFPLFEGGAKTANRHRVRNTLTQLGYQRKAVHEQIEQRIRSAAHLAGASFAGIRQSREAVLAAQKNLELTVDAYSQGAINITLLLDAQNAARIADEVASSATFQYLIDLMELERSIGFSGFIVSLEDQEAFFRRAGAYMEAHQ
ncbi:MAG: TolC family protein [Calditrichaeota bacterium]|nr:TolC family protein [Calditrichota bacterium]